MIYKYDSVAGINAGDAIASENILRPFLGPEKLKSMNANEC